MKFKRLFIVILCIISICVFNACSLFDSDGNDGDQNDSTIEQPDKDPDKDPDENPDKDPDKEPDKDPDENPDKDPDPDKEPDKDPDENPDKDPEPDKEPDEKPDCGKFDGNDFLKTDGKAVKNQNGETLYLRGVNAGGLFVTEHWMTGFEGGKTDSDDYKSLTKNFIERFGAAKTQELWAEYRANWWTDVDFQNCVDMGMSVIRLPFTYMNVDFAAVTDYENAGKEYDFSALDEFVTKAAEYGLYTILDLHGAYGSQNGQDHSGESFETKEEVDFYSNEKKQTLTMNLWRALSLHYKDNPAVAGYDILNEPGEKGGLINETHWNVFDKIYDVIRATGDEHIVIFESCWDGWNLPQPTQYGWENCIYSFHHYIDDTLSDEAHIVNWQNKFTEIENRRFDLPLQMGEFTAYNSTEKWDRTLGLLNDRDWHWTSWTYKVWGSMSWGIFNVNGSKVDPVNDSYNDILQKFKNLKTEAAVKYTFSDSGESLFNILKEHLTDWKAPSVSVNKIGLKQENGKAYAIFSGTCEVNSVEELKTYVIDGEVSGRVKFTLEVVTYDRATGEFVLKAEIGNLSAGKYYLHAGFDSTPPNLPAESAKIDESMSTVTVGNKKYSLGEAYGCRQIIVENVS